MATTRLRYNGVRTTLGSGLSSGATSVTFGGALTYNNGTNVPTITGTDYIPLTILDTSGHLSEIVWLTAYTAAATTGTIVRGKEGTTGVAHSSGDVVVCAPTTRDLNPEDFDDVVTELGTCVHRWKFDQASGSTINDLVGSLHLAITGAGAITYAQAGLKHASMKFDGSTTWASSTGLGSLPVGAAARCVVTVYKNSNDQNKSIFWYGQANTRQAFSHFTASSVDSGGQLLAWSDDFTPIRDGAGSGGDFHFLADCYDGDRGMYVYIDGQWFQRTLGGTLNTAAGAGAAANFHIARRGDTSGNVFSGYVEEVLVFSGMPSKRTLQRLEAAYRGYSL